MSQATFLERHPYEVRGPRTIHLSNLDGAIEAVGQCSNLPRWMRAETADWTDATISGPGVTLSATQIRRRWQDILRERLDKKARLS